MDIRQIKLSRMATFCYLVADRSTRCGALIDPAFDTRRLLKTVHQKGYTVSHVINTHSHPDHVAGNADIISATGARLLIHEQDAGALAGFFNKAFCRAVGGRPSPRPDVLLRHNDTFSIGQISLKVLHTPGHSRGSICLYIPGHVFTGDTLFVGSVGRTDLPGGSARTLLKSIRKQIYRLPEETIVWPGHDYGPRPTSTVGREKKTNPFTA